MTQNIGKLDLNYVPSPNFTIVLTSSEYRSPETGIQNIDWDWMKFHSNGFICGEDSDSFKQQFNSYLEEGSRLVKTGEISARMDVVPASLLAKVEIRVHGSIGASIKIFNSVHSFVHGRRIADQLEKALLRAA